MVGREGALSAMQVGEELGRRAAETRQSHCQAAEAEEGARWETG